MGGALGPYGSTMVTPILHEVAQGLDSTPELAASAVTAYMVPFAALMLVSGTLAERWGRRRTIQVSLTVFVLACALCAFSPTMELFLASRVLQGATNAFTTPLLIAAITDSVPHDRLGRSMGWFAAWQAMGQAFSPLISGVAGFVDWRLSFVAPALCAMALILLPPDESVTGRRATGRASWSSLLNRRLALACALAFLCYLAAVGLTVLSALRAEDVFGLGPWRADWSPPPSGSRDCCWRTSSDARSTGSDRSPSDSSRTPCWPWDWSRRRWGLRWPR